MRTRTTHAVRSARADRRLSRNPARIGFGLVAAATASAFVMVPVAGAQSSIPVVGEPVPVQNGGAIAINPTSLPSAVSVVPTTSPKPVTQTATTKATKNKKPDTATAPAVASVSATPVVAVGATPEGGVATGAPLKAPKYSDPLADLAATALESLRLRPAGGPVQAGASTTDTVVAAAGTPQTQVIGGTPVSGPQPGPVGGASGQSWTSVTLNTEDLYTYFFGTAIVAPQDPKTISIISTLPTEPQGRYQSSLKAVAASVASRIKGAKAEDLEKVWLRTDDRRMTVILTALSQVGTMYRWTGNQPGGFDCSGLTSYSWSKAGVKIPRVSKDQIDAAKSKVQADLLPGDLVWRPGHIGLALGVDDYMVHSPQTGKPVEVRHWGRILRFGSPL